MAEEDAVRSVARALEILRALQARGKATLAELQAGTALPKPTLLRLLRTLETGNAVWRAQSDGLWRPAFQMIPTRIRSAEHQRLIDMTLPALEALRSEVVWPSDLAVREGSHMMLLETTRRSSGLAVNRDEIGHHIDMLRSAVGRAYVSSCPVSERNEIVAELSRTRGLPKSLLSAQVKEMVRAVKDAGYARRATDFGGHDEPISAFDDLLAAIAVPVVCGDGSVLCCINIVWLKRFDALAAIVKRHLKVLHQTAAAIAAEWDKSI